MSVLFRRSSKTLILKTFLKVATVASDFINKVYNGGLLSEFRISMLKKKKFCEFEIMLTVMFNRFFKVATAASSFMNEVYSAGVLSEFSISLLKEIFILVWDCVYETRK